MAERQPILRVEHPATELRPKRGGGTARRKFLTDSEIPRARQTLSDRWMYCTEVALNSASRFGLDEAVVKIKLREQALAKSHRPYYLLENRGRCQVIGGLDFGTLLVSVNKVAAEKTRKQILQNDTQSGTADVTTIESIDLMSSVDTRRVSDDDFMTCDSLAVVLFDFRDSTSNEQHRQSFRAFLETYGLDFELKSNYWRIKTSNEREDVLSALSSHPSVRDVFPDIATHPIFEDAHQIKDEQAVIDEPIDNIEYPVVGVLDGGLGPNPPDCIQPWIFATQDKITLSAAPRETEYDHANFIFGLLAGSKQLNAECSNLPSSPAKGLDARIYSPTEETTFTDIIARMDELFRDFPDVKVWNLSLGIPSPIRDNLFTVFAREIDSLARDYSKLIIIAAGNYTIPPLRPWPPSNWANNDGRDLLGSPADSALGLTVGALAAYDHNCGMVRRDEPAAYSRRGPGPGSLPKPELTHLGGNCGPNLESSGGLISTTPNGYPVQRCGTSFAAPLVANLAAWTWKLLEENGQQVTPDLVKALLIHSAIVSQGRLKDENLPYFGFGCPAQASELLQCDDESFTTVHTVYLTPDTTIEHNLAIPDCLYENGGLEAEFTVTLCYPPELDLQYGAEYCRSNVDLSIGTIEQTDDNGPEFHGKVPMEPGSPAAQYENYLVKHGFKWSPVKVYKKRFRGYSKSRDWRLRFTPLHRAGLDSPDLSQIAHAVITVRAHEAGKPVYRDGLRSLDRLSHRYHDLIAVNNLRVRT